MISNHLLYLHGHEKHNERGKRNENQSPRQVLEPEERALHGVGERVRAGISVARESGGVMNYIKRLEAEKKALGGEVEVLRAGITVLRSYLTSPKFYEKSELTGYVSTTDVLNRLAAMIDGANDRKFFATI